METTEVNKTVDENEVAHVKELIAALDPLNPNTLDNLVDACFDFKDKGQIKSEQLGPENLLAAAGALTRTLQQMAELNISEGRELAYYIKASLLFNEGGDKKQALTMGIKAAELRPNETRTSFWVACLYDDQGETIEAIRWLRRTIDIDPTHLYARYHLAYHYWKCGYYFFAQYGFKTVVAFADDRLFKVSKELRFAKRMIQYLEKKIELFGPEAEDAHCNLDLEKLKVRK